jgi:hypothetical protein
MRRLICIEGRTELIMNSPGCLQYSVICRNNPRFSYDLTGLTAQAIGSEVLYGEFSKLVKTNDPQ